MLSYFKRRIRFEVKTNSPGRLLIEAIQARTASVGQPVVLSCVLARGNTAKFTWTKNGVLLHDDSRVQIVNLRRTSTLNIDDVESSDRGVYTCTAADEDSEDRQSASLTVEGKILDFRPMARNRARSCSYRVLGS